MWKGEAAIWSYGEAIRARIFWCALEGEEDEILSGYERARHIGIGGGVLFIAPAIEAIVYLLKDIGTAGGGSFIAPSIESIIYLLRDTEAEAGGFAIEAIIHIYHIEKFFPPLFRHSVKQAMMLQ